MVSGITSFHQIFKKLYSLFSNDSLVPALSAGDVVFLNNLSPHKVESVLGPIFERGAFVWFLPRVFF